MLGVWVVLPHHKTHRSHCSYTKTYTTWPKVYKHLVVSNKPKPVPT